MPCNCCKSCDGTGIRVEEDNSTVGIITTCKSCNGSGKE